jgi:hypothetical protein
MEPTILHHKKNPKEGFDRTHVGTLVELCATTLFPKLEILV